MRDLSVGEPNSRPSHAAPRFSFSAAPGEDHGVTGEDGSGSSEGAGSVSEGTVTAGRVLEVKGMIDAPASLPADTSGLGTACMPRTRRFRVAGTKAVGFLFPPRSVGRIQTSAVEKGLAHAFLRSRGLTCPRRSERLLHKQLGSFSSALGKVSVEFPFYRNLNGGSEAEVTCPSHLDDGCKSQGSI